MRETTCEHGKAFDVPCHVCDPEFWDSAPECLRVAMFHTAQREREEYEIESAHMGKVLDRFFITLTQRRTLFSEAKAYYSHLKNTGHVIYLEHGSLKVEPPLSEPLSTGMRAALEAVYDVERSEDKGGRATATPSDDPYRQTRPRVQEEGSR